MQKKEEDMVKRSCSAISSNSGPSLNGHSKEDTPLEGTQILWQQVL